MLKAMENKKLLKEQAKDVSGGCPLIEPKVMKQPEDPPPIPGPPESPPFKKPTT